MSSDYYREPKIWSYGRGFFKVYVIDAQLARKIGQWKGCEPCCRYYDQKGKLYGWDVIIPSRLYDRIAQTVGLPLMQKSPKRVQQGRRVSELNRKHRFSRNRTSKSGEPRPVFKDPTHLDTNSLGNCHFTQYKKNENLLDQSKSLPGESKQK